MPTHLEGRRRRSATRVSAAAAWVLVACASGNDTRDDDAPTDTTTTTTVTGGTGGAETTSTFSGGSTGSGDWTGLPWTPAECAEATQYIYVVEEWGAIYRFWPPTGAFTRLGFAECADKAFSPWSMGIDRFAVAWVETNEDIIKIDLASGRCQDAELDYEGSQPGFRKYGLAFAKTGAEGDEEKLFAWGTAQPVGDVAEGKRYLGWFDPAAHKIVRIAETSGYNADLASIGHRLFGFENPDGAETWTKLIEIDTATGARLSSVALEGIDVGRDWAIAAWGGDFYLFTDSQTTGTAVARYRPSTGELGWLPIPAAPFHVIGAGVSTCAPTAPPPA